MVLRKAMVASCLLLSPWFNVSFADSSSATSSSSEVRAVETSEISEAALGELRHKCMSLRENKQIKPFSIKVECSGSYTYWEEQKDEAKLTNKAEMQVQTSTKCGRFETERKDFNNLAAENYHVGCSSWNKKEMRAPEGFGIPVVISECDELTTENVQLLCKGELEDYCEDQYLTINEVQNILENHSSSDSSSSDQDPSKVLSASSSSDDDPTERLEGKCILRTVESMNSCERY